MVTHRKVCYGLMACHPYTRSPQCRASSRAVMDEKSLSPLFPVDGRAVVTNDWCINN